MKCEFMSIQEQKHLSTPDNDQSSSASVTLYLPQYGGAAGMSCPMPTGPILGDPADVRQGILNTPANHPLVRPTGMPIPAPTWPPHPQQHPQQASHPSAQTHHRPGTPSWNTQPYPQPTPTPASRYQTTPPTMTPVPQSTTPIPTLYPVNNG